MTIAINDLHSSHELDTRALTAIRGGFSYNPGYFMPKPAWYGPVSTNIKSLTNTNTQLNIAVLSSNVIQGNSNTVMQF